MLYTTFLLDLTAEGTVQHVPGTLTYQPDRRTAPKNAFAWKVTCDSNGVVAIRALRDGRLTLIAHAKYTTKLTDRKQRGSEPTPHQWWMVNEAIGSAMHQAQNHALPDEEFFEPIEENALREMKDAGPSYGQHVRQEVQREKERKRRRQNQGPWLLGSLAVFVIASIAVYVTVGRSKTTASSSPPPAPAVARPEPPVAPAPVAPPRAPATPSTLDEAIARAPALDAAALAGYRVRWSEVDVPSQTTLAKVEKDPSAEKGKRVCTEGTIERITRTELAGQPHFEGALVTQDGDRVAFVASGSTGELVKRDTARLCGVVLGAVDGSAKVFGMFDLPENRNPTVEKAE